MVQSLSPTLTLEEFLKLPETKPASEYIDGKIIQKPMLQGKHSTIQRKLIIALDAVLDNKKIARAFPELRCTFGGRSTVPDVSVFLLDRLPRDENGEIANTFLIAPDWTIEILSPDQRQTKVVKNILHCLNYNAQMGWLIIPQEKSVFVYQQNRQIDVFDEFEEPEAMLPVPSFASEVKLTTRDLFSWLLE